MGISREIIKRAVDGSRESSLLAPVIEITGNNYAVIQGAKAILEYDDSYVKIKLKVKEIEFWGSGLEIESLSQDSMAIKGKINRIEFI